MRDGPGTWRRADVLRKESQDLVQAIISVSKASVGDTTRKGSEGLTDPYRPLLEAIRGIGGAPVARQDY